MLCEIPVASPLFAAVRSTLCRELAVRRFTGALDLDRLFADLESVAARTDQRSLGTGFPDTRVMRAEVAHAMARGWFRAEVLSIDSTPVRSATESATAAPIARATPASTPAFASAAATP